MREALEEGERDRSETNGAPHSLGVGGRPRAASCSQLCKELRYLPSPMLSTYAGQGLMITGVILNAGGAEDVCNHLYILNIFY